MSEPFDPRSDGCDELLHAAAGPSCDERFRAELLRRTTRVLRRRRYGRRAWQIASLAACYVAGLVTMHWWSPTPVTTSPAPEHAAVAMNDEPRATTTMPQPEERAGNVYRRAGDHFFQEADGLTAFRCYERALEDGSDEELTISPDDNWLLMALKKDKQEEKNRAKNKG